MKSKALSLSILCILSLSFAANGVYASVANKNGNWEDVSTWYQGDMPDETKDVRLDAGIEVTLSTDATIKNLSYARYYTEAAVLNIKGSAASLTVLNSSDLFYEYMLEVNVTEGATFNANKLVWGGGGYYKFNVDASNFSADFSGQFQGSKIAGTDGTYDSGVYIKNKSTATATGDWKLGDSQSSDHYLTVSLDDSTLKMGAYALSVASNKQTTFKAANQSKIIMDGKDVSVTASGANSLATFDITDSGVFGVNTFSANASGAGATVNWNFSGLKAIDSATGEFTDGPTLFAGLESIAGGANSKNISGISNSNIEVSGNFSVKANGSDAVSILEISGASQVKTGTIYIESTNASASSTLIVKGGSTLNSGTINLGSSDASNIDAAHSLVIYGAGSKLSATNGASNIYVGKNDGSGVTNSIVFGYKENGVFHAADAGALSNSWIFRVYQNGSLVFNLGASNASATLDTSKAILQATYFKVVRGEIVVDLTNIDGLADGKYYFALLSSTESIRDGAGDNEGLIFDWNTTLGYDSVLNTLSSVIESDTAKLFAGEDGKFYTISDDGKTLFLNVEITNVPEPAAFAAIAGALVFALAAYRRRR